MKSTEILSNTDRTSWSRIAMVWRFYLPYTRSKLISFATIAILLEIFTILSYRCLPSDESEDIILMISILSCVIIAFSPLVFAKPKGRELQAILPALAIEKASVIIGYTMVIVPAIMFIPSLITIAFMGKDHPGILTASTLLNGQLSVTVIIYSYATLIGMALTCLWSILISKPRKAYRNAILSVGAFYLCFTAVISFIFGFIAGMAEVSGKTADDYSSLLYKILAIICGIYVIFALIKCCHAIKRGQY